VSSAAVLGLAVATAILTWIALAYFTYRNPPRGENLWFAAALFALATSASLVPILYRLDQALSRQADVLPRVLRRSLLIAAYLTVCLGLRMARALNWVNALLLLALVAFIEVGLSPRR